jgi:hypothetical protein
VVTAVWKNWTEIFGCRISIWSFFQIKIYQIKTNC